MNIFLSIAALLIVFSTPSEAGYNSMTGAFSGAFCSGSYVGYYNATPGGNSFCNTFGGHTMVAGETCYCNTSCTGFDGLNNGTYANCFCFHGSGNVPCPSGSSGSGGGGSGGSGSGGGGSGGSGSGGGGSGGGGATCPPGTHCCGGGGGVGPGGSGLETGSIQFIDWLFGKINPIQCSHAAMVPGGTDPCSVCCPNATPTPTPNTGTGTTTATATATATFAPIFTPTPSPTTDPFGTGTVTAGPIGFPSASPPAPSPSAPCTLEGEYRPGGTGACVCPPNYQYRLINGVNACRPNLPLFKGRTTSDFFLSSDPISNYYPVCGSKRIAVTPGGAPLNVSSNSWPNSTSTVPNPTGTGTYLYAKANGSLPEYLYPAGSWCACTFKEFNTTSAGPATAVESSLKIPPDTFGAISSVTSKDNVKTSPVPIGHDSTGTIDARVGDQFAGAIPKARCGCADLNAEAVALDPAHPNDPQGAYCRSMIPDSDPHRVLVEFNPAYHDVAGSTQVVNRSEQPQISNVITTRIALPLKTGASAMKPYTRRIWACSSGFTVDVNASPPVCVFDASKHMCSNSVNGALASAVTIGVTGSTPDIQFTNAINKKHNCCIAAFSKGYANEKFDCIDNSKTTYSSFDQLWASADDAADGGQLNAIVLRSPSGAPISGFYRLNGSRCNGKSEFGGTLQPAVVNPAKSITGQSHTVATGMSHVGSALPLPSGSGATAYASLQSLGGVPNTEAERLECPILVRAAIKVECNPTNPPLPAKQTTYVQPGNGGHHGIGSTPSKTRCVNAKNIYIHTQVRQLTEIAGMRPLKTFDTIQKPDAAANISVKSILEKQIGGDCAAGMKRIGADCVYQ